MDKYLRYPRAYYQAGEELKKLIDDYWDGKISESVAKEYVRHYAKIGMLFKEGSVNEVNPTVYSRIQAKRKKVILRMLGDYRFDEVLKRRE